MSNRKTPQRTRGGWLKIYRKLLHHPRYSDTNWFRVWMHLLLKAAFRELPARFDGRPVTLKPGQLITTRRDIAIHISISEGSVKRSVDDLLSDRLIEVVAGSKHSMITVLNWSSLQCGDDDSDPLVDQQMIGKRSADDPLMIHQGENHQAGVHKIDPKKGSRSKKGEGEGVGLGERTILDIKDIIAAKEESAQALKNRFAFEEPTGLRWDDEVRRQEFVALRKGIRELKEEIGRRA